MKITNAYNIERVHASRGVLPTSIWISVEMPPKRESLVALVGLKQAVQQLITLLDQPPVLPLPSARLTAENKHGSIDLQVLCVGAWPIHRRERSIVEEIKGEIGDGPEQWNEKLRRLAKNEAEYLFGPTPVLPDHIVHQFAYVYLHECQKMLKAL